MKHIGGRAVRDFALTLLFELTNENDCLQGVLSAAAGIYATAEYAATSIRQTKDPWNAAFGGAMAGLIPGILSKNGRFAFGSSLVCGVVMAASDIWADNTASPFEKFAEARTADRA